MKHQTLRPFVTVAGVCAAMAFSIGAHGAACNVNMTANQQTLEGFGFSSAWCGTLSSAKNNALYGMLGMSLLHIRIDEGNNWTDEINNVNAFSRETCGPRCEP